MIRVRINEVVTLIAAIVTYFSNVIHKDIPSLDDVWRFRIKMAIEQKLTTFPDIHGIPLRRSLKGLRKLRVGDYRVVFRIKGRAVYIFVILHRSEAYKEVRKRMR